jgi:hypothetical protein
MTADGLLQEISAYCRQTGMAETTFGRRAVNDGKFASRLRCGSRVTLGTLERVRSFIQANPDRGASGRSAGNGASAPQAGAAPPSVVRQVDPEQNFRFFDNRQKYLMFVNTCGEKWVVARRVSLELANIHPRPPAVRVFEPASATARC